MESATAKIPPNILATALKAAASIELDPAAPSFETAAAKAVRAVLQEPTSREVFYQSLDAQWDEQDAVNPVVYPETPGPLLLAEQRHYEDDLDTIEPTGWPAANDTRGRVLVVDDSLTYRTSLKSQLEGEGYDVVLAEDGWDALGQSLAEVDILVVDIMMPRMTGIELVDIIHHRDGLKHMPVLMITSAEVGDWESRAAAVGASVLSKPVAKDRLLHEIQASLHAAAA